MNIVTRAYATRGAGGSIYARNDTKNNFTHRPRGFGKGFGVYQEERCFVHCRRLRFGDGVYRTARQKILGLFRLENFDLSFLRVGGGVRFA